MSKPVPLPPRQAQPAPIHPAPASSLPTPITALVGRESELAQVRSLLDGGDTRLVNLSGPGGIGKTRLALAVAATMEPEFANGVCFVGLASVRDPGLIPATVARALGIPDSADRPLADVLLSVLRERHLLLVLDNLEHVIDDAALWTSELLERCPRLSVLATSRVPLQIAGEHRFPVPPLSLPESTPTQAGESATAGAAVELFIQRARAVRPDFEPTTDTLDIVRAICLALDGLPLAIELAAARMHVLSPESLLARLTGRLEILQENTRDAEPRHRTMRDTFAWSHDLLSPEQQALFRRLAVFTGGFSLEAAEAIGGDRTLDTLNGLLNHSLLRHEPLETGESRYRMLEVIREYGLERLQAAGESEIAHDAMAAWCLELVNDAAAGIEGSEQVVWLSRLDAELDNIRRALAWLQERERIPEAQDLAGAIVIFLVIRAHYTEARALFETLVAHPLGAAPTLGRAWCLCGLGIAAFNQGADGLRSMEAFDESVAICRQLEARRALALVLTWRTLTLLRTGRTGEAEADCMEAVELARDEGYRWGEAAARAILGSVLFQRGDLEGTRLELQTSIDLCLDLGESWIRSISTGNLAILVLMPRGELDLAVTYLEESDRLMWLVGERLNLAVGHVMRAEIARARRDSAKAEALLHEALAVSREMDDPYASGHALRLLGILAAETGDVDRAARLLREAIAQMGKLGAANDVAACLDGFVDLAMFVEEPGTAARLIGATDAALAAQGASRWDNRPGEHADRVATVTTALGEDGYRVAWEAGHALSLEETIAETLAWQPPANASTASPATSSTPGPASDLTPRELEVLRLMAEGLTNQQIADRLYLSRRTATSHASNILAKLDLPSRTAAVAWAIRNGIA